MRHHACFSGFQPHHLLVLQELELFDPCLCPVLSEVLGEVNAVPTGENLKSQESDYSGHPFT